MSAAAAIRDFYNATLARDGQLQDCVMRISLTDLSTGKELTIDGAVINAHDTFEKVLWEAKEYIEMQEAGKPSETPVTQARETHVAYLKEITHAKKTYYVEEHKDGTIVIQTPNRTTVDLAGKIGQAILEKYKAEKDKSTQTEL